jgi:pimeloyl-ACP methyl ester carboxylesterase
MAVPHQNGHYACAGGIRMSHVRDRVARVGDLRLHFRDWDGPIADAPVLVLLHGAFGDARMWDSFAPMFATRYRVIAPDARGHGESDWSAAREYAPSDHAEDVRQLLAGLGCDRVSIIGSSLGGFTACVVAAQFPELVDKLVVIDVSPGLPRPPQLPPARFRSLEEALSARITRPREHTDAILRELVERSLVVNPDGFLSWRYDQEGLFATAGGRDPETYWRMLEQIKAPTLVIRGKESEAFTPELAQRMRDNISDSELVEIPDAGHPVPRDQPARFFAAVVPFLFD